ncbi:peptide/nickel transport system ATP-binding protein [Saccharothrix tamanrassetensis]|uniref:Peptide/nickel transport system ATP-binding protein n=1 Tax=Saccharothrix tamanrassetensis TaxID=1051531 RepID=A0A841CT83_9PSEU|nr:ABC transporter ATP-binding protein [Saccharothrix tamanrassetensis]MBB5958646.1 peptide/nickel transport system ATP-binding protein [Saccharothrix tamanrassetensis]
MLDVRDLTVHDGRSRVLVRGVSFRVGPGETVGLVGESGSGKSLTARALVSLLPQELRSGGSARLDDTELLGRKDLRGVRGHRVALLMQDPFTMLNPLATVGTHLVESLPGRADRVEVARRLAEVGIDDPAVAGRYPFQLSGGMRQRVALAAALAKDPGLLIADEPTTALDVTTQRDVLALLRRIQTERRMGLVLITHDLRVARQACDRVLVMYAGALVESARSADLDAPAHPYTAGLLRSVPSVTHRQPVLLGIPGSVPAAADVVDRCPFADRCGWAEPACTEHAPPLVDLGDRATACRRHGGIDLSPPELAEPDAEPVGDARATLLDVADLVKVYRSIGLRRTEHTALAGVSLHVGEGESLAVVGESGSGKTTLARAVLGLTDPTSGRITLGGLDVTSYRRLRSADRARARRLVQCVFQDPYSSLNPAHTVGYTLAESLRRRGEDLDVESEVDSLLDLVGLPASYAGRRPVALSGGQRQRVAIARALAVRPRLLVCDEPVAALDVSVQAQVLEVLRKANRELGIALLFITHDLAVARQVTDRMVVMHRGRIVEHGATADVLDAPTHPYTVRLVQSVPDAAPHTEGEAHVTQ